MNLRNIVQPNMNIPRSINLDRDYRQAELISDYHITAKTTEILSRFVDSLEGEKVNAWSLTGPYGMGKSAFVNYLLSIAGPSSDPVTGIALKKIELVDVSLHKRLSKGMDKVAGETGFFRVPVTAAYESVNNSLARGLSNVIRTLQFSKKNKIQAALNSMLQRKTIESSALFDLFCKIQNKINKPMMIVVDEFGKNLDFMSTHHDRGDIFIMQQLAEMDSIYLWVCLHQSFDGYASGLSSLQRREWSKVQGRFEDISFVESTSQMIYLMKKALKHNFNGEYKGRLVNWANNALHFVDNTDITGKKDFNLENIQGIYPLHPVTAVALIELCTRFAQNDRTLLAFMCNNDRLALSNFLDQTTIGNSDGLPAVGLDYLYDYFFNISITAYINRAESQRWIEIHDIIDRNVNHSDTEKKVLKTIGVLNLLSGSLGLKATPETIVKVIGQTCGIDRNTIEKDLNNLVDRGVLLYREYAGEYRLWEGSDFNIQKAINDKREKLEIGKLDYILQKYLPLHPVIASRHSYKTGTVRRFERRWLSEESFGENLAPQKGLDGLILYCFGTLKMPSVIQKVCADGRPLVIAYVSSQATLKELALDVAATRSVLNESTELAHDSVARKEIKFRIKVAEENFRSYLAQLFTPGSEKVIWYVEGEKVSITDTKMFSTVLSNLCDKYYCDCPPVRNEMISYEKLSSAAARARRVLVEAMITQEEEENLGLEGFGPEVAIYKTLLQREGLHVKDEQTGCWQFTLNINQSNEYQELWAVIDQCLDNAKEGITVEEILNLLKEPPFGLRQGPAPIYVILYLIVHSENIAVFQEGTYRPYLSAAEAALMIKRPDLFTLKKYIFSDIDRAVFNTYKNILKAVHIKGKPGLRNTNLIGIVGPLINFIEGLPDYTKNTRQISREARRVCLAIQNSMDPARLIFEDLPKAVGVEVDAKDTIPMNKRLQNKLHAALYELSLAFPNLNEKIEKTMLTVFECDTLNRLMEIQRDRVKPLVKICDDEEVRRLLLAMKRESRDAAEWVKGIAGLIVEKPIESWGDHDLIIFETKLHDYANRINHFETLAAIKGNLSQENSRVISMMMPDGSIRRAVITNVDHKKKKKAKDIVSKLTRDEAQAILEVLAEELLDGADNE